MSLIVSHITKGFSGVIALYDVTMEFFPGQVHALIGENGAGKSTLMKILSGVYTDYEGEIIYQGQPVRYNNPKEAQEKGISIIHQELNLIPGLSIMENVFLGRELTTRLNLLDKPKMRKKTVELLNRLQLPLNPDTLVGDLKVGQQQVVEMAKALLTESNVIIMDEPTSAISEAEVAVLFGIIESLRRENKTIIYISHKLDELFRIADRYIVLRDGRMIEAGLMAGMQKDALVKKMVGREIRTIRKPTAETRKEPILTIENLALKNVFRNISFEVGKGEILGIFGLMGAGRTELLEAIFGLHPKNTTGRLSINQKPINLRSPYDAKASGLALVPEDRKKDGLVLGLDVQTNIALTTLPGILNKEKETALCTRYIRDLQIKTSTHRQLAKNLSGGNQQKIVLAKWLATKPTLLMLDEPTRGIDIHAKTEIYNLILELAEQGLGIIVVSSELPEILAIADRVLVLCEGRITADVPIAEADETSLLKFAIPESL
jgi:ribose transport system ATP-binding protein